MDKEQKVQQIAQQHIVPHNKVKLIKLAALLGISAETDAINILVNYLFVMATTEPELRLQIAEEENKLIKEYEKLCQQNQD